MTARRAATGQAEATAGSRRDPTAREVALVALERIDEGAYANLALPHLLRESGLDQRDRAFVTDLVYGTTRMRRNLDWRIDRHARGTIDPETRRSLRLGCYQLAHLRIPPHAAVDGSVRFAPRRSRGLVNAVLRRVAADVEAGADVAWPSPAVRLSYPDWIVERLGHDLGTDVAEAVLAHMNEAPGVAVREDGYVQDRASQWVAAAVGTAPGQRVLDLCSAPGGKATAMAGTGARVTAVELRRHRARLVVDNARRLGLSNIDVVGADGARPPFRAGAFDRVLVDAPCSGLGVLHRRPDARWRVSPDDVADLVVLQRRLLEGALPLVRRGGVLVLSVCTLTAAETVGHDDWLRSRFPTLEPVPPPGTPWEPLGRGARLLPQSAGTDGMALFAYRVP